MPISPPSSFGVSPINPAILTRLDDDDEDSAIDRAFQLGSRFGLQANRQRFDEEQQRRRFTQTRENMIQRELLSSSPGLKSTGSGGLTRTGQGLVIREEDPLFVFPGERIETVDPIDEDITEGTRFEDENIYRRADIAELRSARARAQPAGEDYFEGVTEGEVAAREGETERDRLRRASLEAFKEEVRGNEVLSQEDKDSLIEAAEARESSGRGFDIVEAENLQDRLTGLESTLAQAREQRDHRTPASIQNQFGETVQTYTEKYRIKDTQTGQLYKPNHPMARTKAMMTVGTAYEGTPYHPSNLTQEQRDMANHFRWIALDSRDNPWTGMQEYINRAGSQEHNETQRSVANLIRRAINQDYGDAGAPQIVEQTRQAIPGQPQLGAGDINLPRIQEMMRNNPGLRQAWASASYMERGLVPSVVERHLNAGFQPPSGTGKGIEILQDVFGEFQSVRVGRGNQLQMIGEDHPLDHEGTQERQRRGLEDPGPAVTDSTGVSPEAEQDESGTLGGLLEQGQTVVEGLGDLLGTQGDEQQQAQREAEARAEQEGGPPVEVSLTAADADTALSIINRAGLSDEDAREYLSNAGYREVDISFILSQR